MSKKKIFILSAIIIIGLAIIASVFIKGKNAVGGNITKAELGTIQKTVEETGTVFSKRVNTFYSDMSKTVKVLNVSIGEKVKKGDIILTYENNYDLEIEVARKQIESITASYKEISKGADFQQVSNEKLNINTIENNLEYAKRSLEKIKALYEDYAVSKAEYEEAENNVKVLENQLQEAKNNYQLLVKGVSANIKHNYEAQIEEIMLQINILEKNKRQSSVIAEFDGIITELNVHQGGMTQPGVVVVEIQDEKNLGIYVELLADDVYKIHNGLPVIIKNQNSETEIDRLKVDRIYPKALTTVSDLGVEQKRVRVEADMKENKNNFKIGTEVDVVIVLEQKEQVLLLKKDAVYEISDKKYVSVKKGEDKEQREITTGIENDKYVEILSGLSKDDEILIEANK